MFTCALCIRGPRPQNPGNKAVGQQTEECRVDSGPWGWLLDAQYTKHSTVYAHYFFWKSVVSRFLALWHTARPRQTGVTIYLAQCSWDLLEIQNCNIFLYFLSCSLWTLLIKRKCFSISTEQMVANKGYQLRILIGGRKIGSHDLQVEKPRWLPGKKLPNTILLPWTSKNRALQIKKKE